MKARTFPLRPARAPVRIAVATCCAAAWMLLAGPAMGQELLLAPVADATLYAEDADGANGAGTGLFAGRTDLGERRRALLRFDLSALPDGATVTGAELSLTMDRTITGSVPVAVHRVLASWGEGDALSQGQGGIAAPAGPGDATWQWRFHGDQAWDSPGGDRVATASATTSVAGSGRYSWTGAGLLADVQAWQADPAANHGWLLQADELVPPPSAKRFASREALDAAARPQLRISYSGGTAPPPVAAPTAIPANGVGALLLLAMLLAVLATRMLRR